MKPTVTLMLKAPRQGEVKTRLAREVGDEAAVAVYRRLVEHQLAAIPADWIVQVHYSPADAEAEMETWLGKAAAYFPQPSGDLGARLVAASQRHFSRENSPLIFLGGDCPYLTREYLKATAELFASFDAVLAPACDGGYCLLGLGAPVKGIFQDIAWSTGAVLEQTRERLRQVGARWIETEMVEDVDDRASWQRAVAAFPGLGGIAPPHA